MRIFGHGASHKRNQLGLTLGFDFGAFGELGVDLGRYDPGTTEGVALFGGVKPSGGDQRRQSLLQLPQGESPAVGDVSGDVAGNDALFAAG